jgi:hypothetical protein
MLAALLTATASAQDFSYTYIQGSLEYIDDRASGLDLDAYGGSVGGSYAISNNFHIFAGYSEVEFDDVDDFDVAATGLGIGFNTSITDAVDFVTTLSWIHAKVDLDSFGSDSDNGVSFDVGIRSWVTDYLEFNAGVGVSKLSDSDNDAGVSAGLMYYFNDNISVGLSGSWSDSEIANYGLNLRYNFGN